MSIRIGLAADLTEGELRAFDAEGTAICVTLVGGRLLAVDDTCTHAGCSLADGELDGTTITCPCHGSRFDAETGAVLRGPAERPVRSWSVRAEGEALVAEP
jgi:nitrite reductase/ring-hydroxylating ferredoxin subunit